MSCPPGPQRPLAGSVRRLLRSAKAGLVFLVHLYIPGFVLTAPPGHPLPDRTAGRRRRVPCVSCISRSDALLGRDLSTHQLFESKRLPAPSLMSISNGGRARIQDPFGCSHLNPEKSVCRCQDETRQDSDPSVRIGQTCQEVGRRRPSSLETAPPARCILRSRGASKGCVMIEHMSRNEQSATCVDLRVRHSR